MFPQYLSRCSDIKIPCHVSIGPRYLDVSALILLLPHLIEVTEPELNVADDVDGFSMLDEALRHRIYAHGLDAGLAVKHISPAANLLGYRVLEKSMDQDHIASCKLFASAHLLLHHLTVMDNKFKIKIAHCNTGFALAGRCLLDVPQTPTELEIGCLNNVL